jgi:hypothetical protein
MRINGEAPAARVRRRSRLAERSEAVKARNGTSRFCGDEHCCRHSWLFHPVPSALRIENQKRRKDFDVEAEE